MLRTSLQAYLRTFAGLPRRVWLLALAEFVNRAGDSVLFFASLYLTQVRHLSLAFAGTALTVLGIGGLIGSFLGGWLLGRLPTLKVQQLSLMLTGTLFLALPQMPGPASLLAAFLALGVTGRILGPANATAIAQVCPPDIRPRGFALRRVATNLGVTIGPTLGGVLALLDYSYLFWMDGLTCFAAALVLKLAFTGDRELSQRPPKAPAGQGSPLGDRPFVAVMLLVTGFGVLFAQMLASLPLYLSRAYGFSEPLIGLTVAVNTALIVAVELPVLGYLRGISKAREGLTATQVAGRVVSTGVLCVAVGLALLPWGRGLPYALGTTLVWTAGEILAISILTTTISERAGNARQGAYQGYYSLAFSAGMVIGPALGARGLEHLSGELFWSIVGLFGLALAAGFLRYLPRLIPEET